jgi:hypothetical protein
MLLMSLKSSLGMSVRVFSKTEKGQSEIQTRAHRLAPRLRQALILVDGKRDEDGLSSLIPGEAFSLLDSLLSEGFISVVEHTTIEPRPVFDVAFETRAPDIAALRRDLVRALNDALGPAAEGICMRVEKSKSMVDLGPTIGQAVQMVRTFRGEEAANAFAARFVA